MLFFFFFFLKVYRSLRGTSHLEGYHSHLHKATRDAPNHGAVLSQSLLLDLNFRFSIESAARNVDEHDHYECIQPWLLDTINTIYIKCGHAAPYPKVFVNKIRGEKVDTLLSHFTSPKLQEMYTEYLSGLEGVGAAAGRAMLEEELETELLQGLAEAAGGDSDQDDEDVLLFSPPPNAPPHAIVTPADLAAAAAAAAEVEEEEQEEEVIPVVLGGVVGGVGLDSNLSKPMFFTALNSPSARSATRMATKQLRDMPTLATMTMQQIVHRVTQYQFGNLPDIPRDVKTKEEEDLFERLVQELVPVEDQPPDFEHFCKVWNTEHVFPNLSFEGKSATVIGPIYLKDPASLRKYHDRAYTSKLMGKKAVQSMQGGEEGYKQAMKRAHTSKHFTAPAPRFQQSIPKTAQPQDDEDVVHVAPYDPRFLSDTSAPQAPLLPPPAVGEGGVHAQVESRRRLAHVGKVKHCKNCGSRRGKEYNHASGKNAKPCSYQKDQFKDTPEALLNTNE